MIIGQSRLGVRQGDLVVFGVELHQHRAGLDVLVVIHHYARHVACNAGADGIDIAVDLGVVRGFPGGKVAIQQDRDHDESEAEQGQEDFPAPFRAPRRGLAWAHGLWRSVSVRRDFPIPGLVSLCCHSYFAPKYCSADCSATPMACAREIFARLKA